jgi:hypothetical protein
LTSTQAALKRITDSFDEIDYGQEWLFVVGDYGTGKTQLKNQIQEIIDNRSSGMLSCVSSDLQEDSLDDFVVKFVQGLKQLLNREHQESYSQFQALFKDFSKTDLTGIDKTRIMVKLLRKSVTIGLRFLIQFDELDQLQDLDSFQPWASLMTNISDRLDEGILVVVYITEREITRLWNKDTRLVRLQAFLTDYIDPGSRFGEKYTEGVANIFSIYQVAENMRFSDQSVELLDKFLRFHKRRLQGFTLRQFNIAAYLLADMLHTFDKHGVWKKVETVKKKDKTVIGQKAEKCLIQLLQGTQFPFTVEDENYLAEIEAERVRNPKWQSDGRIHITKEIEGEFVTYSDLPLEIKYTTSRSHESAQLKNLEKMTETDSTILFSIGVDEKNLEKMHKQFEKRLNDSRLVIIPIESQLFDPVFSRSPALHAKLREWVTITARVKQYIQPFLEEIVKRRYRKELEDLRREFERIKATASGPTPISNDRQPMFLVSVALVALFNKTTSGVKRKNSLPKHVLKQLDKPVDEFDRAYNTVLKELLTRKFLEDTGKSFKITDSWDQDHLDSFCKEMGKN